MNSLSQNWVQCQFCVNLRLDLSRHVSPQYWAAALCLQQLSAALSSSLLTNQFISCFAISDEFFQNNRAGAGGGRNVTSHLLENWWSHECRDRQPATLIFEQISHRTFRGTLDKYFMSIKYLIKRKLNIIIFYSKPWMLFYEKFPNSFLWIHEYFCFQPFTVTIAINAMKNSYEYHYQAVIQILSASITNIKPAFYLLDFNG